MHSIGIVIANSKFTLMVDNMHTLETIYIYIFFFTKEAHIDFSLNFTTIKNLKHLELERLKKKTYIVYSRFSQRSILKPKNDQTNVYEAVNTDCFSLLDSRAVYTCSYS